LSYFLVKIGARILVYDHKFSDLVGNEEEFFDRYLGKAPLLRCDALTENLRGLLSVADCDEILHQEALRAPYLRLTKNGDLIDESTYTGPLTVQGRRIPDCVVPDRVHEHFRSGATIMWHSLNQHRPNVRALNTMLANKFAARSETHAFLTPPGKQGFAIHHDRMSVFVLQLHGSKRWRVWPTGVVRRPSGRVYRASDKYDEQHLPEPFLDISLAPGDVMYIPPGTPHAAVAEDKISLHLSVTLEPSTWSQLTRRTVAHLLEEDKESADRAYLSEGDRERQAAVLRRHIDSLIEQLTKLDPLQEVERLACLERTPEGTGEGSMFQEAALVDEINASTIVRWTSNDLAFRALEDGRTGLFVNEKTIALDQTIAQALREIGPDLKIAAADFVPELGAE